MTQYIDKDALVAEIEKRLDELYYSLPNASDVVNDNYTKDEANITGKYTALESFSKFLDTLEVKEVDLKKELDYKDYTNFFKEHPDYNDRDWGFDECWVFAEHFFKLGLKAQKGE